METITVTAEAKSAILYALQMRAAEMEGYLKVDRAINDRPGIAYWTERITRNNQAIGMLGGEPA